MIDFSTITNIGSAKVNEDNFGFANYEDDYCFAVADGLGGHGGGDIASRIAVDAVCDLFVMEGYSASFFEKAFGLAQSHIIEEQRMKRAHSEYKTTLTILVIHDGVAQFGHVGDTRGYYFHSCKFKTRTKDHSVPQMLVDTKKIKEEDIRHHSDRSRLMRVMGLHDESPRYELSKPIKLRGRQEFLICTDGFWEWIKEDEMEECMKQASISKDAISLMAKSVNANAAGHTMDNYTGILVFSIKEGLFHR